MQELTFIKSVLPKIAAYVCERHADKSNLVVSSKSDVNDLLTEADIETQRRLVENIHEAFPGDAIFAEEGASNLPNRDPESRCWVVDPIDGTQNFVRSLLPLFGVSLALAVGGEVQAGGVITPMTGDLYTAVRGGGAFHNGTPVAVSSVASLGEVRAEVDFAMPAHREESLRVWDTVLRRAGQLRCHGAAVIGLCSVANGDCDAYLHVGLNPWDLAAGVLLIEEAGGRATRLDGSPLDIFDGGITLLATNGACHDEVLGSLMHGDTPA